ncbi:hypothetical protein U1Q18_009009 [Sarracenia purpurea var. burkii]
MQLEDALEEGRISEKKRGRPHRIGWSNPKKMMMMRMLGELMSSAMDGFTNPKNEAAVLGQSSHLGLTSTSTRATIYVFLGMSL